MERCGFFDANLVGEEYDRVYLAASFAAYFSSFIGNGIFGGKSNELQVVPMETPSMQISVLAGQGYINGYWYENADNKYLPIDIADGVLNRIDSIVLRLGFSERDMWLTVKKGTPDVNPVTPTLTRNADYYELQLATIRINAGAISVRNVDITDTRLNPTVCGLVMGLIQQFDTTAFGRQLQEFIDDYIVKANTDYATYFNTLENLKVLAQNAYQAYLLYLEGLKNDGRGAFEDYLIWLGNLKTSSVNEIQDMLDQLAGLIDTEIASALDARITTLEDLRPINEVADITHSVGHYAHVDLYELEYGAGVQLAGYGPAGGSPLISTPCEYTLDGFNRIIVKTKHGYGVVEGVAKLNERAYVVFFAGKIKSLLIMLKD